MPFSRAHTTAAIMLEQVCVSKVCNLTFQGALVQGPGVIAGKRVASIASIAGFIFFLFANCLLRLRIFFVWVFMAVLPVAGGSLDASLVWVETHTIQAAQSM